MKMSDQFRWYKRASLEHYRSSSFGLLQVVLLLFSFNVCLAQLSVSTFVPMMEGVPAQHALMMAACGSPEVIENTMNSGLAVTSQDFGPSNATLTSIAADNFILSNPSSLVSVSVSGITIGPVTADSFLVVIYSDDVGTPGGIVYSEIFVDAAFTDSPTFDLAACPVLDAGTYWLAVQAVANPVIYNQWFWHISLDGDPIPWHFQNPGDGFSTGCTSWTPGNSCTGIDEPGLVFSINLCPITSLSSIPPNCRNINVNVGVDGLTDFSLSDVVTNYVEAAPSIVTITRGETVPVWGPETVFTQSIEIDGCKYLNETLRITVRNEGGTCWSNLTFKETSIPIVESRSETVYCYEEPSSSDVDPPLAFVPCMDPFDASYVTDWIIPYDCEPGVQDTVKVILREWEAYDKYGRRGFSFDTIVVLQFPEIDDDHIYCEERDTLFCGDSLEGIGPYITFERTDMTCDTLFLVDMSDSDNDGIIEFAPAVIDSKCGIKLHVEADRFPNSCEDIYKIEVDFKQVCYGNPNAACPVTPPAGVDPNMAQFIGPGHWRCIYWLHVLDTLGPDLFCKGDPLFEGDFRIEDWSVVANPLAMTVDSTFFDPTGSIDLSAMPYQLDVASAFLEPGSYSQNVLMEYMAEKDLTLEFGWNFHVPSGLGSLSYTDIFIVLNGEYFPLIEEGDVVTATARNLALTINKSRHGVLNIPLRNGDKFAIGAIWESNVPCVFSLFGQKIVSTSTNDCAAHSYLPYLKAKDDWSGVKQAKAIVQDIGTYILEYNEMADCWQTHDRIKLPNNGEHYTVIFEVFDSCHNLQTDSCIIYVKDRIKPVPVMDKKLSVTLNDKKTWLSVDAFDEGSKDNCGLNLVLLRRSDWQEACMDICDQRSICYEGEHHDTLWQIDLIQDKEEDEVQAHYSKTLQWLCEDNFSCAEIIYGAWMYDLMQYASKECSPYGYALTDQVFDNLFEQAYFSDESFRQKFNACQTDVLQDLSTEDRFSPFRLHDLDRIQMYKDIGGGWSTAVPFDCEDACKSVTVEMLVMDYWCNWSKSWDEIWVEDKTPPQVAKEIIDETFISCKSYRDAKYTYKGVPHDVNIDEIVSLAMAGESEAFAFLDSIFGGYRKAWKGEYNTYVDASGTEIDCDFTFFDSSCVCVEQEEQRLLFDDHLGYYWKDTIIYDCYYKEDTLDLSHGIVLVNCAENVHCEQEIYREIDHCGEGYLYRKFKIWQGCADTLYSEHNVPDSLRRVPDTLYRYQRIDIGNSCDISRHMFEVPSDTTIEVCDIEYGEDGNLTGELSPYHTGHAKYSFDDDCRIVGIMHRDKLFRIVSGREACYKLLRTWYFADWCGQGGPLVESDWWQYDDLVLDSIVQTIILVDTVSPICEIVGPVSNGDTIEMGTCSYELKVSVESEEACGLNSYSYYLMNVSDRDHIVDVANGSADLNEDELTFDIIIKDLTAGDYSLKVEIEDGCHNQSMCFYDFVIRTVTKPTPICFTSLSIKLPEVDSDNDGIADGAEAVVWATELDRSSVPACGDDELEYRIELVDQSAADATYEDDEDFLVLSCGDVGVRQARLWVISKPSNTVDYCDMVLMIQTDYDGCQNAQSAPGGSVVNMDGPSTSQFGDKDETGGDAYHPDMKTIDHYIGDDFALRQNVPNPFTDYTTVSFHLPVASDIRLSIFDINGKVMKSIVGRYQRGEHQVYLRRSDIPSGSVLFYRLDAGTFSRVRKMVVSN